VGQCEARIALQPFSVTNLTDKDLLRIGDDGMRDSLRDERPPAT
jgi:hypothetical protein